MLALIIPVSSLRSFIHSAARTQQLIAILTLTSLAIDLSARAETQPTTLRATCRLGVGTTFQVLPVGPVTYHEVRVRAVTARSLVILHRDGLASIRLRDLTADLQQAFGYSPEIEAALDATAKISPQPVIIKPSRTNSPATNHKFEELLQHFSQPPELRPEVDLRPRFADLGLYAKSQGRRPSCAVFAVVSALEFQNAELLGYPEKLSEEYLIWATRKILGRTKLASSKTDDAANNQSPADDEDEGFALTDVVTALRTYGIAPEVKMPDTLGRKMQDIQEPSATLIDDARSHQRVAVYPIPGRDSVTILSNIVQALDAGTPVVVGLRWPHANTIRSGYLSTQQPMPDYGHAVTLVGYRCTAQSTDSLVFIFKNSWGVQWGGAGFGQVTYGYLKANLCSSVILEVKNAAD